MASPSHPLDVAATAFRAVPEWRRGAREGLLRPRPEGPALLGFLRPVSGFLRPLREFLRPCRGFLRPGVGILRHTPSQVTVNKWGFCPLNKKNKKNKKKRKETSASAAFGRADGLAKRVFSGVWP